jgi:hypothetical protein
VPKEENPKLRILIRNRIKHFKEREKVKRKKRERKEKDLQKEYQQLRKPKLLLTFLSTSQK